MIKQVKQEKGFTFVELLIIMIVVAILSGLGIQFVLSTQEDKAKITNAKMFFIKDFPSAIYGCLFRELDILACDKTNLLIDNIDSDTEWGEGWRVGTSTITPSGVESVVLCYPLVEAGSSNGESIANALSIYLTSQNFVDHGSSFTFVPSGAGVQTGIFDGCTGSDYAVQYVTRN